MSCPRHPDARLVKAQFRGAEVPVLACPEPECAHWERLVRGQRKLPGIDPGRQYNRLPCPSEEAEMRRLWEEIARHERQHWCLTTLFHVPNERADRMAAIRLSQQGVRPGVPDILSPVPKRDQDGRLLYRGLALELKREREGQVSDAQCEWLDLFRWLGWRAVVCRGWQSAWEEIVAYFDLAPGCPETRATSEGTR